MYRYSYLFHIGGGDLFWSGHGRADDPLEAKLVDVERRAVAVHENHGGGKVEHAGRQDSEAGPREERVAGQQACGVEVVATSWQHHHSKQRH